MTVRPVHWHEGMFIRPHHFQASQRWEAHLTQRADKWNLHYCWGLRSIEVDLDALANYRFVVRSMQARLRDGTLVSIPEDGVLPALEIKNAFQREHSVTIFLAVPIVHLGRANVSSNGQQPDERRSPGAGSAFDARYLLDMQELEDENTGVNPQPIQVRLLNLRLLLSNQDHTGYEVLPIARIERSPQAEAPPQLNHAYIPPVLACDAWQPLRGGVIQNIYDRIGKKLEALTEQIHARSITFDSTAQGERMLFEQLRILNQGYSVLHLLSFAEGVHPLHAYIELTRLVGQLAIFGPDRRAPNLPVYDHDDLGGCFWRAKQHIDALLDVFVEPEYKERPFAGAGLRMQVSLEPTWVEPTWQMFIGVQSPLDSESLIALLTRPGQLDMKVGSSERVDTIFRQGLAGLSFNFSPTLPPALPQRPGLVYFQINRDARPNEWFNVQKSLSLAIRLNENRIAGNIQGQRMLTIHSGGGQTTTLQFTLYVVPVGPE